MNCSCPAVLVVGICWSQLRLPGYLCGVARISCCWLQGHLSVPKDVQEAFDKKQYEQVLELLAKLEKEQDAAPDVHRLKIRSFLKLGNPKDALGEYDKLELALKQDEVPLLREVALGFIVVMVKDMREQMRGAAYTALKEVDSDEVIPYFEDGLSDGSGPVRALAVEGLGRSEIGEEVGEIAYGDRGSSRIGEGARGENARPNGRSRSHAVSRIGCKGRAHHGSYCGVWRLDQAW